MTYYLQTDDRLILNYLLHAEVCAECGGKLESLYDIRKHLPYLQCRVHPGHIGIAKEYEQPRELNIEAKRSEMETKIGIKKANQLIKYQGVTSLTRRQAMEILDTMWPDAPATDKVVAAIVCASYGLNPLAGHIFLIPFKDKAGKKDWVRVWGIKAKRLLASRRGGYSYLDMSPRLMTKDEQIKVWGEVDEKNISFITHLKDMDTGAEVFGYGKWPKGEQPYGTDKGNSQANMASIRSESQALDRLRPAEMPSGFEIADENYIEPPVPITKPDIVEVTPEVIDKLWQTEDVPSPINQDYTTDILLAWVMEQKGFEKPKTARDWLVVGPYKIKPERIDTEPRKVYEEIKDLVK